MSLLDAAQGADAVGTTSPALLRGVGVSWITPLTSLPAKPQAEAPDEQELQPTQAKATNAQRKKIKKKQNTQMVINKEPNALLEFDNPDDIDFVDIDYSDRLVATMFEDSEDEES